MTGQGPLVLSSPSSCLDRVPIRDCREYERWTDGARKRPHLYQDRRDPLVGSRIPSQIKGNT
jgi:hypothetical protein